MIVTTTRAAHGATEYCLAVARLLADRTGLTFAPHRPDEVASRVRQVLRRAGVRPGDVSADAIVRDEPLLEDLVATLTVGETYFFRDPAQFDLIRQHILPALLPGCGDDGLRIWSAGCASGEEPYSLAILLHEMGRLGAARIVGTDLCRTRLDRARAGRYTRWSLRGLSPERERAYFSRVRGQLLEVAPAIRGAVQFHTLNLRDASYPSPSAGLWRMDLVLCRNVLLYLDEESVARVATRLLESLSDDGWLLLAPGDPPIADLVPCHVEMTEAGAAYRRTRRRAADSQRAAPVAPALPAPRVPVPPQGRSAPRARSAGSDRVRAPSSASPHLALVASGTAAEGPAPLAAAVRAAINRGELADAGRACAAALDRFRMEPELHYLDAALLTAGGHFTAAAAAARRVLYLDRGSVVGHLSLAEALARLGDTAGAREAYQRAERILERMPPSAPVPGADGARAGELARLTRLQRELLAP